MVFFDAGVCRFFTLAALVAFVRTRKVALGPVDMEAKGLVAWLFKCDG